ncbi:MAG: hypothetical protein AMS22_13070 [Thiotrichales bacterium SG8_50]|nr:MAG: hypothetical protein AMS22_13070 [Thiotrichales bacterium SG8_50]
MSDAFHDAIRERERYEAARADGVAVYVVKITNKSISGETVIGACYLDEAAAAAEVKRLNDANSFTRASYVRRLV